MNRAHAILIAALAISLAGCLGQKKPVASTPPPPQQKPVAAVSASAPPAALSMPQTQVQLPPAQPVDQDALPQPAQPEPRQETPPSTRTPARTRPSPPAATHNEQPAVTPPTPEPEQRGPVREVLDPAVSRRLKISADAHKRDVRNWLNSSRGRKLEKDPTVAKIRLLLKGCDEAEQKGDMREASDLADRAVILMRELQSVR